MRSELVSIAVAVAFHVTVPLVAKAFIDPNAGRGLGSRVVQPIDVELAEPTSPQIEPQIDPQRVPEEARPIDPAPTTEARVAIGTGRVGPVEPVAPIPGITAPEGTAAPNAPPGGVVAPKPVDEYGPAGSEPSPGGLTALGGLGRVRDGVVLGEYGALPKPKAAPTEAPRPRDVDPNIGGQLITAALSAEDDKKGLNLASGAAKTAALNAVQGNPGTPDSSRASFVVDVDANGRVLSVKVGSYTAGSAAVWEAVARAMQASLAAQSLPLGGYSKGMTLAISVTTDMTLPSGATSVVSHEGSGVRGDISDILSHKHKRVRASVTPIAKR